MTARSIEVKNIDHWKSLVIGYADVQPLIAVRMTSPPTSSSSRRRLSLLLKMAGGNQLVPTRRQLPPTTLSRPGSTNATNAKKIIALNPVMPSKVLTFKKG